MALSDAKFLTTEPVAEEPRPNFKQALAGVGDKFRREAGDYFLGFTGTPLAEGQAEPWAVGDIVEYETPDGVRRCGQLLRPHSDTDWLVRVDEGEAHIVPQVELHPSMRTPRHAHRAAVQTALKRSAGWTMRRQPALQADGTVALTLDVGHGRIADFDVEAYADQHGLHALDAAREGNLLRLTASVKDADQLQKMLGAAVESLVQDPRVARRMEAQALPMDAPSDPTSTNQPGLEAEELQGSGVTRSAGDMQCCMCCGDEVQELDDSGNCDVCQVLVEFRVAGYELGATVQDESGMCTVAYTRPQHYVTPEGKVTATLSESARPLRGYFAKAPGDAAWRKYVSASVEAPYSTSTGPLGTRYDDKEIPVKAVDEKAKDYFIGYYGPYGKMLVRDFAAVAGRDPTDDEVQQIQALLYSEASAELPESATTRVAQRTLSAADIVMKLLEGRKSDPRGIGRKLDTAVVRAIATDPMGILEKRPTYAQVLYSEVTGGDNDKLIGMYRKLEKEDKKQRTRDFGSPSMFRQQPSAPPSSESASPAPTSEPPTAEQIRRDFMSKDPAIDGTPFSKQPSGMQDAIVQRALEDAQKKHQQQQQQQQPQQQPQPPAAQRPSMRDRARGLGRGLRDIGQGLRDRLPGSERRVDRLMQQVEDDDAELETIRTMLEDQRKQPSTQRIPNRLRGRPALPRRAAAGMHNKQKPLGHMSRPLLDRISSQGSYLCIRMTWCPDETRGMSDHNIKHNLVTWLKGMATLRDEYADLGFLGRPRIKTFDPEFGLIEFLVRSSEAENFPAEVTEVEGKENNTRG